MLIRHQDRIAERSNLVSLAASAVSTIVALAALINANVKLNASSTWRHTDETSSGQKFTTESWVCQMSGILVEEPWWGDKCTEAVSVGNVAFTGSCG